MKTFILIIILIFYNNSFSQTIPRNQTIIAGEYFTNKDPGEGKGTLISTTYGSSEISVNFNISLSEGSVIYVRFKNSSGIWGPPRSLIYRNIPLTGATVQTGEYFINQDPGISKGTPFTIGADGKIDFKISSLSKNDRVYIRVKDSYGRWSEATGKKYDYRNIRAAQYYVRYSNGTTTQWKSMSIESQSTPSAIFKTFSDNISSIAKTDSIFVRMQDDGYFWSPWYKQDGTTTDIKVQPEIPKIFSLSQNFPNPFNPSTKIKYSIPKECYVNLKIFDALGREIITLVDKIQPIGEYEITFNADNLPSGIYFYRLVVSRSNPLQAGEYTETRKMLLLK